jgi:hypothetical protein
MLPRVNLLARCLGEQLMKIHGQSFEDLRGTQLPPARGAATTLTPKMIGTLVGNRTGALKPPHRFTDLSIPIAISYSAVADLAMGIGFSQTK